MKYLNLYSIKLYLFSFVVSISLTSCLDRNPNKTEEGEDILSSREIVIPQQQEEDLNYADTVYVPIYSDIYISQTNTANLLAATLSIRNTSLFDSLYVSTIDYYDTKGALVRRYLNNSILLSPMESIDYVVEREDETGGSGANFILTLSSSANDIKPLIQAVMVGYDGNKGFSFVTDAYSISR